MPGQRRSHAAKSCGHARASAQMRAGRVAVVVSGTRRAGLAPQRRLEGAGDAGDAGAGEGGVGQGVGDNIGSISKICHRLAIANA